MQRDRRIFKRTESSVDGQLQWQVKRRTGLVKTNRTEITTIDLSVDGARITTARNTRLPIGASVLISFGDHQSSARVRALLPDPHGRSRQQLLLLQFENPSAGFLREVDRMLDENNGGSDFKTGHWENVREDEYGEAEHASTEPLFVKPVIRF